MLRRSLLWGCCVAVLAAGLATACSAPTKKTAESSKPWWDPKPPDGGPVRSDIVSVNKFFHINPWLSFNEDGSRRVNGVKFAMYLQSPSSKKGVFGTGTIVVQMYRLDEDEKGSELPVLVQEWQYSAEKAYPFRAKEESYLGWGYGFRLKWDEGLEVEGKRVAFLVKYVRDDGRVVISSRQEATVPVHGERSDKS